MTPPLSAPVRLFLRHVPDPVLYREFSCFRKRALSIAVDVEPLPDGTLRVTSPDLPDLDLIYADFDQLREGLPHDLDPDGGPFRFGHS